MTVDDLTVREIREIMKIMSHISDDTDDTPTAEFLGKKCIVRTYASGVHFGTLKSIVGRQVVLTRARRLWKWHARDGISLSEVAMTGIDRAQSRIAMEIDIIIITDALEVIPTRAEAAETIEGAEVAGKS